jgi:hypothetical protein
MLEVSLLHYIVHQHKDKHKSLFYQSESRPMEQEVERECELQMQLREFESALNTDSDEMTPGVNVRLVSQSIELRSILHHN